MKKLLNPFNYLSGGTTMGWGAVALAVMAFTAWHFGSTFRGVVSQGLGNLALWQLVLQQAAGWGIFASLLYLAGRMLSKSRIRAVDIYGNQLMARMPLLLILLGTNLTPIRRIGEQLISMTPDQLVKSPEIFDQLDTMGLTLFGFAAIGVLIWFFAWSYQGYAVAANLKGWRAAGSYVVCYLAAEIAAAWCTTMIGRG